MPIISLTRREKIVIRVVLGLRYETTPAQLRAVLEDLRALLTADLRVYPESARARLINLGDSSLAIEVFAQLRTTDGVEFLGIQEELLLRMMDVIAEHGLRSRFRRRRCISDAIETTIRSRQQARARAVSGRTKG